jgi:hypothetical protein
LSEGRAGRPQRPARHERGRHYGARGKQRKAR